MEGTTAASSRRVRPVTKSIHAGCERADILIIFIIIIGLCAVYGHHTTRSGPRWFECVDPFPPVGAARAIGETLTPPSHAAAQVAIQGCVHGELDKIYATIAAADTAAGRRTELVILCGDVQALRNPGDLASLAVPDKYKRMGDFQRYYAGATVAPYLTVLVGGNHEGSGYLDELALGGWVAPNMYFLGHAGAVHVAGLTVAGLSGIYKDRDYDAGRWERAPYTPASVRSAYHVRRFDVDRLALLASVAHVAPDVLVTHDWPASITRYGDAARLFAVKPFFRPDAQNGELGNPHTDALGEILRPRYWFAAHLHTKFPARIEWPHAAAAKPRPSPAPLTLHSSHHPPRLPQPPQSPQSPQAPAVVAAASAAATEGAATPCADEWRPPTDETRFLALGKCSRANEHLQVRPHPRPHPPSPCPYSSGLALQRTQPACWRAPGADANARTVYGHCACRREAGSRVGARAGARADMGGRGRTGHGLPCPARDAGGSDAAAAAAAARATANAAAAELCAGVAGSAGADAGAAIKRPNASAAEASGSGRGGAQGG